MSADRDVLYARRCLEFHPIAVHTEDWGRTLVNPPLAADDIVTRRTLTRARPVSGGETWTTELTGVALNGICVRFA